MASYGLVCPFLTDEPEFALGVEFGFLFMRMKRAKRIKDYFCLANQEQILLLANRLGWKVKKIKPWGKDWFWCVLERRAAIHDWERPHQGLH